jgi:hypothetical protein
MIVLVISFKGYSQEITYAEYFIDSDPGIGMAQSIEGMEQGEESTVLFELVGDLSIGHHQIGIRTKDAFSWSQTNFVSLLVLEPDIFNPVSEVEYFMGTDPGFGDPVCNDTVFDQSFADLQDGEIAVKVPSDLTPGNYLLFMRTKDGNGQWAHTQLVNHVKVCSGSYLRIISDTAFCDYTSPSGMLLTESGNYRDFVSTPSDCDSSYIIQLTIESIDTSVYLEDETLFADNTTASDYQWIDCDNGGSPVPNAVNSSFKPENSGNFAVIVSANDCTDTSNCHRVTIGSTKEIDSEGFMIFPNPNSGTFSVNLADIQDAEVKVVNLLGEVVLEKRVTNEDNIQLKLHVPSGIYILKAFGDDLSYTAKIIVK